MVYKRNYQLQSPKKGSHSKWETSKLLSRHELVEELSSVDVDEPTLSCHPCCGSRVRRCSRLYVPLFRPIRVTSLFWMEKFLVLLDYFQVLGLLWIVALPWPWPARWRRWTSWSTGFNLDSVSLEQEAYLAQPFASSVLVVRSTWGVHSNFVGAWIGWMLVAALLPVATLLFRFTLALMSQNWLQFRAHGRNFVELLLVVTYVPVQLWLSRTFSCEHGNLAVDSSIVCLGAVHTVMLVFSALGFCGMLWMAALLVKRITKNAVHSDWVLHERHLRWKEAEYLHFINAEWLEEGFWVWSSFTRFHAHYRPLRMVMWTALILNASLMRGFIAPQASIFLILTTLWAVWTSLVAVFRCGSTRIINVLLQWLLVANSLLGCMRAYKISTALTVDSSFSWVSLALNAAVFAVILVILILSGVKRSIHWPAPTAVLVEARSLDARGRARRRNSAAVMPDEALSITQKELAQKRVDELKWVSAMLRGRAEISQAQMHAPELIDPTVLDGTARQLREMWREARACKHVLSWSLLDAIDQVSVLADSCRSRSYLPNPHLTTLLPGLAARLRHRHERLSLVRPERRRILIKLLAVRSWIGNRVFARIPMGGPADESKARYMLATLAVSRHPPSSGAVSVMSASDLLREMPAILQARPVGHPKVTRNVSNKSFDKKVRLMRVVRDRWAELLLEYERSFRVASTAHRDKLQYATEVAAWYSAARQMDAIVTEIERIDPMAGRGAEASYGVK